MSEAASAVPDLRLRGVLHILVAFDWGDEVDLDAARRLVASDVHTLPRKSRTPSSFAYDVPPLRIRLAPPGSPFAGGLPAGSAEATLFDFAALTVAVHQPLELTLREWQRLAGELAEPASIVQSIRASAEPLFELLKPTIQNPLWSPLSEEYFVFQFLQETNGSPPSEWLSIHSGALASLVRLETAALSPEEIRESLRLNLGYSPNDLFVADWAAAVLFDNEADELLDIIAFANLQLLEYRRIDNRLDGHLQRAYGLIQKITRRWLPFWRPHTRPLRELSALKLEANVLLERTGNALKLVGDPYVARAYHLLAMRFHLTEWDENVRRALSVLQEIHQAVSEQSAMYRAELLEFTIVVLIVLEIVMALVRH